MQTEHIYKSNAKTVGGVVMENSNTPKKKEIKNATGQMVTLKGNNRNFNVPKITYQNVLQILLKQLYDDGLLPENTYIKTKADIEKL